jgi:diguanylate cyclase (GGDEF)-like protein
VTRVSRAEKASVKAKAESVAPTKALPRVAGALRSTARAAAIVPIIVSVLVLFGWWRDVELLKSVVPGLVAMNPTTAIGLILLGLALALLLRSERSPAGQALGAVAALLGLIKLASLQMVPALAPDHFLFRQKLGSNQMAPNTALNFLLVGLAVMNIDRHIRRWWPSQFLTIIAAMSSVLALMGYAYGVQSFYSIGSYIPIALHTAAMFLMLAIGVLCARPTRGMMAIVTSASSGGMMIRRLLPAILIVPAALGWIRHGAIHARIFDPEFEDWLLVVLIMTALALMVGWNGRLLFRSDLDHAEVAKTLAHQATHDALTQLPNRRLFIEELERELQRAKEKRAALGVLFIDLDLFKVVNDSLGHVVGDELLIAAGKRVRDAVGEGGLVARMSGDEFTVLLPKIESREETIAIATRVLDAFRTAFTLGPHDVFTTVSIGIAFSGADDSPVALIRHADMAMYKAKARGKARIEIFDPSMDIAAMRRLELEKELRRALANGELRVYYQPEVEIESGELIGMEALVRWEHPQRGLVPPSEFIGVAEETGLIVPIGRWVLFEACRQANEWQKKYRPDLALMVSVNLSGKHFQQATLIVEVSEVLRQTGIDPHHVILEITETVAMEGAETTIEILTKLKSLGVKLAIDDFGTGFSSLSYLKRFPVDLLKVDKSFVDGIALAGPDNAIVQATIALGHALGLKIISEGVETPEQVEQLRKLGAEIGQGYFYSPPLSDDTLTGLPKLLRRA